MTGVNAVTQKWAANSHNGSWRQGSTAGGCRNYLGIFFLNFFNYYFKTGLKTIHNIIFNCRILIQMMMITCARLLLLLCKNIVEN